MIRFLLYSAMLAVALLVSGCAGSTPSDAERQAAVAAATSPAKLQPGDKIRIVVFGEENLNGEYQVDQSGQISLPLAGTFKVQGLTQAELEQELAQKFRSQYLKSPKVTVTITTLRPYYMMGEVKSPGQFAYQSGLNVLTAMAIAGGPTYRANRTTVEIQRLGETSMHEYPISAAVPSLPGDVIKVA